MVKKSKLKLVVLIILIINISYILLSQQVNKRRLQLDIDVAKQNMEKSKEENQKLQDEVKISKTDKYIEKLGREKLDLVKEGETPVINSKKDSK